MRKYRQASRPDHRFCNRCDRELPATPEVFLRDASRHLGLAYECRECHRERKRGRDNRSDRWANLTAEQKKTVRKRQQRYNQTPKGRAIHLRKAYQRIDACDFDTDDLAAFLQNPCYHCGTTDIPRGLDRIDNNKAHTKDNVVASCSPCNFARGDRFSFEEMKEIGAVIRQVLERRKAS